jgi:hypothetical protein
MCVAVGHSTKELASQMLIRLFGTSVSYFTIVNKPPYLCERNAHAKGQSREINRLILDSMYIERISPSHKIV